MPSAPDYSWLQWIKIKLGLRDNEYDTGTPGKPRPLTGITRQAMQNIPPNQKPPSSLL